MKISVTLTYFWQNKKYSVNSIITYFVKGQIGKFIVSLP